MRKFLVALVLLIGILFIITRFAELQEILETLQLGDWRFIGLAVLIEVIWLMNLAVYFQAIYRALGINEDIRSLLYITTAANFVNVVAPSAGMGGVAVLLSEARRRGYSPARVTVAGMLYALLEYWAFLCVLGLGLFVLFQRNRLNFPEIVASSLFAGVAILLAVLLLVGMRSTRQLDQILTWLTRLVNRILRPVLKRDVLSEQRTHDLVVDATEGLGILRQNPRYLLLPASLALTNKALLILILFLSALAFNVPLSGETLIAGFSLTYLFTIMSPTPSGIGIVEGVLTLALRSMDIRLSAAAVITLAYRGVTFWLPLFFGMFALRSLGGTESKPKPSDGSLATSQPIETGPQSGSCKRS